MPGLENLLEEFEKDEYLGKFINRNNKGLSQFEIVCQSLTFAEQLNKLSQGLVLLDKQLQEQVLENHEDLLSQATWIEKLESVLAIMSSHAQSLFSGVERLQSKVSEPYEKLIKYNIMLGNILETLALLRRIARIQVVAKRLTAQVKLDPNDILKISENIKEFDQLWNEVDLNNIKILEADKNTKNLLKIDLEKRSFQQLQMGLETYKPDEVKTAIIVLHNLHLLSQSVNNLLTKSEENVQDYIKDNLNIHRLVPSSPHTKRGPGRAAIPVAGYHTINITWTSLEKVLDLIYKYCSEIEFLENCLKENQENQYSSRSQTYLDLLPEHKQITEKFWIRITKKLCEQLKDSADKSSSVREAFEMEYPKFLRFYMDLCKKLQKNNEGSPFKVQRNVILPFEKSYLSKSVSLVLDPVNNMFLDDLPTPDKVDTLIRVIANELSVALVDPTLSSTVAKNVTKCVKLFGMKCDGMIIHGEDACQVIKPCSSEQLKNIAIANVLEYFKCNIKRVASNLGSESEAATIVIMGLAVVDDLIAAIMKPVLESICRAVYAIILTMHKEDFSKNETKTEVSTSLYMRELDEFIRRSYDSYLKPFQSEDLVRQFCIEAAGKCIELFIRHVSFIRPLGSLGRLKLTADCNQLESALAHWVGGELHLLRLLRSFRPLLTQTPEEILKNPALGKSVPYSIALYLLFTHAPDEMPSPHQCADLSVEVVSSEMDNTWKTDRERIDFIRGAIEYYCNQVKKSSSKTYHPVYPIMIELMQRATE